MSATKSLIIPIIFLCMLTTACETKLPASSAELPAYDPKQAIANGDVVSVHGEITNLSKLDNFINKVHNAEKDKITITTYTMEGDTFIKTLSYNGKVDNQSNLKKHTDIMYLYGIILGKGLL